MSKRKYFLMGRDAGIAAGSWAIDGNTSAETCARIMQGYDDGDPEVLDMQPSPLSGEHAGESIPELFGHWPTDRQLSDYEAGFSEGFWDEVIRACKAQV